MHGYYKMSLIMWQVFCKYSGAFNQMLPASAAVLYYTPRNEVVGGYTGFTMSVRLSVRHSVRLSVRL
jgi:hypothetical protein